MMPVPRRAGWSGSVVGCRPPSVLPTMRRIGAFALIVASSSCTTDASTGNPTRETLPNGATLVRYPNLPAIDSVGPEITDVQIDLQFGSREGDDPNLTFGNIRGVQAAEQVDSVYMGETTSRAYRSAADWGTQIPFDASDNHVVNPSGGFWSATTDSYRLTRTGEGGDTLLVIEASLPGIPVTSDDRSAYVERWAERQPEYRRDYEAVAALMPDFKPILQGILVDDEDRLWVRRTVPADASPFFDRFSQDGDYLGSVRLAFQPGYRYWIQHGKIYTWIVDDVGVQYVVRAPLS